MTFEANASLIILLLVAIFIVIDVIPTTVVAIIGTLVCGFLGPTMGFFDVAWVGVPLTIIGFIYMLTIGKKTLPQNTGYEGDEAEEIADSGPWDKKAILTAVIFSITLIIMMIQPKDMPLSAAALSGAIILIITGCISEKEAYQSIDMRTMLLFTGLMTITTAVNNSGGGKLLAGIIMKLIGSNTNPYVLTFILGLICVILTSFISNTAATMILGTVAIHVAQSIGVNPTTMLMVVVITANACFATPVGGISYTLVMEPGRYKFKDFVRMGLPLALINLLLAIAIIPLVWSF